MRKLAATLIGLLFLPRGAVADRGLQVELDNCQGWIARQVEHLARLELGTSAGGESVVRGADVTVRCLAGSVLLAAREARGAPTLVRELGMDPNQADAERVVAIAIAQLVRALDWLPEPAREVRAEQPRGKSDLLDAAEHRGRPAVAELRAGAGLRARGLAPEAVALRVHNGAMFAVASRLRAGGALHYEQSETERGLGQVEAQLMGGAFELAFRFWQVRPAALELRAELGMSHVTLTGRSSQPGVEAYRLRGLGLEGGIALGPVFSWGRLALRLEGVVGGAYFGGEGLVSGADPVVLNGPYTGGELSLGVSL